MHIQIETEWKWIREHVTLQMNFSVDHVQDGYHGKIYHFKFKPGRIFYLNFCENKYGC